MSQSQMSQMGQQSQTNRANRPNFAGITNGPNGGSVEMRYNTLTNAERPSNVPSTWQNKNEIENEIVQRDELRYDTRTNAEREVEEQREQERRKVLPIGRYHPNMLSMRPCGSKERPCDPVRREDTKDFGMLTEQEERRQKQQFVQPNQQTQGEYLGRQERTERLDRPEHPSRPENLEPPEHPIYGGERVYIHPKDRNVPLGLPVDYRDYDITAAHANHPNHPNQQNLNLIRRTESTIVRPGEKISTQLLPVLQSKRDVTVVDTNRVHRANVGHRTQRVRYPQVPRTGQATLHKVRVCSPATRRRPALVPTDATV